MAKLIFLKIFFLSQLWAYSIKHLEPPFWWTDMKSDRLQLMVHGPNIADLRPSISHDNIIITDVKTLENPNYLFINLEISKNIQPGQFDINFLKNNKTIIKHNYTILERDLNSMHRNGFSSKDVIYLITPDRYANGNPKNDSVSDLTEKANRKNKDSRHGGDLKGIIDHLDYISDMGFTQIWLNPVLENNQPNYSYHGYSTTDYYNIDARFGSNQLYKELSAKAKKKGIGIIMDLILNHIGSGHWWMNDLPSKDWINFEGKFIQTNHIHEAVHDPHLTQSQKDLFTDGWFVETMPDLNQDNEFLSTYLIQASIWWIEFADLSGYRIDTYPYVDKNFLSQWSKRISEEYPNFNYVGEEWTSNVAMVSYWQKGSKTYDDYESFIPSMMDFPLQSALNKAIQSEERWDSGIRNIYRVLSNDFQYGDPYNLVVFAGNHDMIRIYSELNENMDLYKMAMTFISTVRGIPQIYYGTEIAMTSTEDHGQLRKDFPGGWPDDKVNAFIDMGLKSNQLEAKRFLKKLLNWRKNNAAIIKGNMIHYPVGDGVYVYFREHKNDLVMVAMNNNEKKMRIDPQRFYEVIKDRKSGKNIFNDKIYKLSNKVTIPAKTVTVLEIY
tara:strand:- start:3779 stop:5608 length:1830 start_codon:yes stop_codon:yes gene_type:complete